MNLGVYTVSQIFKKKLHGFIFAITFFKSSCTLMYCNLHITLFIDSYLFAGHQRLGKWN